jgi:hypothetical protein
MECIRESTRIDGNRLALHGITSWGDYTLKIRKKLSSSIDETGILHYYGREEMDIFPAVMDKTDA